MGSSCGPKPSGSEDDEDEDDDEEDDEEEDNDDCGGSILSPLGEALSGEGGSCSVPGSISEESRVSVSEGLAGDRGGTSVGSALTSAAGASEEEEEAAVVTVTDGQPEGIEELVPSPGWSSPLLTRRRFTGVAPSSSAAG